MSNGTFSWSADALSAPRGPSVDLAVEAARQGASDAREAADRFAKSASRFMARFVYTTCYTVSYGVVFPSVMVARSIPRDNAIVRGFTDGASAARTKVDAMLAPEPIAALADLS